MNVRVNRWLDLLDRAGWTAVQAFAGAILVFGLDDWKASLAAAAGATVIAVAKVIAGQHTGSDDSGAVVPGQVLSEPARPEAVG